MNIPNFFIVGAVKAGTSSMYHYLKEHPDIYMSPIKEPFYFSKDIDPEKFNDTYKKVSYIDFKSYFSKPRLEEKHIAFIKKWEDYIQLFREVRNEKAIGEISNGYLYSKVAAENIKEKVPYAKIVMILRNPIDRAFSHFLMDLRDGGQDNKNFIRAMLKDFNSKVKGWGITHLYIELGLYYDQVKRYLETFSIENIKIFLFDDLRNNTSIAVRDVLEFLEVEASVCLATGRKYNVALVPKLQKLSNFFTKCGIRKFLSNLLPNKMKQEIKKFWFGDKLPLKLSARDKEFLLHYFEDDIKKLSKLIGRDLSDWLKV